MTHAVGLRTYQIVITKKRSSEFIEPDASDLQTSFSDFLASFVSKNTSTKNLSELEKSWKFNPNNSNSTNDFRGTIAYGRYGYAASLHDIKTGDEAYRRKRTDSEIINLYYRFWLPDRERFAIVTLQSFSGRSCITIVFDALKEAFEADNPGFILKIHKLMPSGASARIYAGKPVKNIRLVTKKPPNDLADRLFSGRAQRTQRMSISIYSGRNSRLGEFSDLIDGLPSDASGALIYDGIEFDQAIAEVKVGKEIKKVGVFGAHADVGVIDITEDVTKDREGLPQFNSVDEQAERVLAAIYDTLRGQRRFD